MIKIKEYSKCAIYRGVEYRFYKNPNSTMLNCKKYIIQADFSLELLNHHDFRRYDRSDLSNKVFKSISEKEMDSAYYVDTFAKYQGVKFQVDKVLSNGKIRIWHTHEAMNHFKDYAMHGYDPHLEVNEEELEEVWEERKPIEGFKFDVEPLVYLKKNRK